MPPKIETGVTDRCNAERTSIKDHAGRPPMAASNNHPKLGVSTRGPPSALRIRSVLKPSTPIQEPMTPTPPKLSPGSISVNAQSSSVVAPVKNGNAACMLFSLADLRLPRTAPLSAKTYHANAGFDGGRYPPCRGRASTMHSSGAATSTAYSNSAWLASPGSGARPPVSSLSPPRLAALSPLALPRPVSPRGKLGMTKSKSVGRSRGKSSVSSGGAGATVGTNRPFPRTPASSAARSRGFDKDHFPVTRRNTIDFVVPLETPIVGKAGYAGDYGLTFEEATQRPKRALESNSNQADVDVDQADPSRGESLGKNRSLESLKSGAHSGMSVAEFADKVAALAAEVAKVFGRKKVPQSADSADKTIGLE